MPTRRCSPRCRCGKDVLSPLAPRNDEEGDKAKDKKEDSEKKKDDDKADKPKDDGKTDKQKDDGKADKQKDEKKADAKKKDEKPKPVEIDLAGFEERVVVLPPKAGRYDSLAAVSGKLLYRRLPRVGSADEKSAGRLLRSGKAGGEDGDGGRGLHGAFRQSREAAGAQRQRLRDHRAQGRAEAGQEDQHGQLRGAD